MSAPTTSTGRDRLVLDIMGQLDGFPIPTRDVATLVNAVLGEHPGAPPPGWVLPTLKRLADRGELERWGNFAYHWRR